MTHTIEEFIKSIDTRVHQLTAEHAQLKRARDALHGAAASRPARERRIKRKTKMTAQSKSEVVPAEKLIKLLVDNPGSNTSELANLANADSGQVLVLLKEAEQAGDVRREGARRATRWSVITDEDRIRARAAQLRKQSRQAKQSQKAA